MNITREEILAMPAGAEMDAMIAEEVMGWHLVVEEDTNWKRYWHDDENHYQHMAAKDGDNYGDGEDFHLIFWHPSQSILWAWDVVERLDSSFSLARAWLLEDANWKGYSFWVGGVSAFGETAPLAICRAALLAVIDT